MRGSGCSCGLTRGDMCVYVFTWSAEVVKQGTCAHVRGGDRIHVGGEEEAVRGRRGSHRSKTGNTTQHSRVVE